MSRIFLLDAMNLAYRSYYAFIRRPLVNSRNENTSVIFGFANTALKIRREEGPDYWALAWDGPGPTERHARYAEYKANRKPMPQDLLSQIPVIEDLAQALGLAVIELPGLEADDVMATLARRGEREGHDVVLVTSDKDLLQLVSDKVRILSPGGHTSQEYSWLDRDAVVAKWGVPPEQLRDVLALMGDTSDNIPGVPGVGEKTAVELIRRFGSLDSLYERLSEIERPALREKLARSRDDAFLSRELVTVHVDSDIPVTWDAIRCGPLRRDALVTLAKRYELVKLERIAQQIGVGDAEAGAVAPGRAPERRVRPSATESADTRNLPGLGDMFAASALEATEEDLEAVRVEREPVTVSEIEAERAPRPAVRAGGQASLDLWASPDGAEAKVPTLEEWTERLHEVRARAAHGVSLYPILSIPDARTARLVGLGLATRDGISTYVPLGHEAGPNMNLQQVRAWIGPLLADPKVPKVGEDLKRDAHVLATAEMPIDGFTFDVHLASFLCDPDRDHSIEAVARDFLGRALPSFDDAAATRAARKKPDAWDTATAAAAAEARALAVWPLAEALRTQLEMREQWSLYEKLEHPVLSVLLDMERAGVLLDVGVLEAMNRKAATDLAALEESIYAVAGERFNINSGRELARLLFEKLGLKAGRRTKTGFSTDQAVLEELASSHELPQKLLDFRALSKLKSTYLEALPLAIDPLDHRVHTTFNQAGAATGRLSSSNPNLQNIPMRTPQGREIRRAFVAPPGRILIGADYSQIELRLMAHLSGDENMIDAFESGQDVHASTARKIFGIMADVLDPALRSRAKIVNFGIMYGMGARSLSQQMGISLTEAQEFIQGYFRVFSRVREYLDTAIEDARRRGYVQTLFGRRRYLPGLGSANGGERALSERVAINAPIQGSAADLVKIAMARVHHALKQVSPSARLLLQVHDELLLECSVEEADAVADRVRTEMEGCVALRVPLHVSVGRGKTWLDVH